MNTRITQRYRPYNGGALAKLPDCLSVAPQQVGGFSLLSVSGLTFWIEARNTGFTYGEGDDVILVNDLSGNLLHLTGVLAVSAPTYRVNSGKPYIESIGNKFLLRALVPVLNLVASDEGTIIIVKRDFGSGSEALTFSCNENDGNRFEIHNAWSDHNIYMDWGAIGGGGRLSVSADTISGYFDSFHIEEWVRNGNDCELFIDGVSVFTGTYSDSLNAAINTLYVCGGSGIISNDGFAAIAFWNRALTNGERQSVRDYLNPFKP